MGKSQLDKYTIFVRHNRLTNTVQVLVKRSVDNTQYVYSFMASSFENDPRGVVADMCVFFAHKLFPENYEEHEQ